MTKKLTTSEFIEKAIAQHGEAYEYSKVVYVGSQKKILIICPEHGEFKQKPNDHLSGKGCAGCSGTKQLTTETFIEKSIAKHGEVYDYSKVVYVSNKKKILIICPEHGEFEQQPASHLSGHGCAGCSDRTLTTETFIEKAIAVHGEVYDYSKVAYLNAHKKIIIICPEHGEFKQEPANHLSGKGCAGCSNTKKQLTTETFIEKSIAKHGEAYDYSKVVYVGSNKKILIICQEHGEFEQTPNSHLSGKGCIGCSGNMPLTTETFIEKAITKHGEAYDYSKVAYLNAHKKIIIICPEHGEFKQKPNDHLSGQGCAGCYGNMPLTTETFIEKAITKHGDAYDYSKVVYVGTHKKILIICPEHGEFKQTPNKHLRGNGCAGCAKSGFDSTKPGILYHICFKLTDSRFTHVEKIGITNRSVKERFTKEDQETFDFYQEYPFENGIDALNMETAIKRATKEHAIEENDSPINDGWTEIRTCNLRPVLLNVLGNI